MQAYLRGTTRSTFLILTLLMTASWQSDTARVRALNQLGQRYILTHPDSTYFFAEQALHLAERLKDVPGQAEADVLHCSYYIKKGEFNTALDWGLRGLQLLETRGTKIGIPHACVTIAQAYKEVGGDQHIMDYLAQGIVYAKRAFVVAGDLSDTVQMVNALNETGIIYRDLAKGSGDNRYYDSAIACYRLGLALEQPTGKGEASLGHIYNNLSAALTEYRQDYAGALGYLQMAVAFNERRQNISGLSYNYGYMAHIYHEMGDTTRSLDYARRTLVLAHRLGFPDRLENAYVQLSESFVGAGRYDSALSYTNLGHDLGDSLANRERTRQIADMQTKYETAQKAKEIRVLSQQNVLLAAALVVVFLAAGAFFWQYRRVRRQKRMIGRQADQLATLMKELHHRVKNNLQIVSSLLSLQSYKLKDEEAIAAIRQSQLRVRAMSLIHQRLYQKDETAFVNIREYLTDLAESLLSSYGYDRDGFDLRVTTEQHLLDVDKVLLLGLIANEIITNSLKYAYRDTPRPSLDIRCTGNERHYILSIKDNGPIWDTSRWHATDGSFGKKLVSALCQQLHATQELDLGEGTQFTFIIPHYNQVA